MPKQLPKLLLIENHALAERLGKRGFFNGWINEGELICFQVQGEETPWLCTPFSGPGHCRGLMVFRGWESWERYEDNLAEKPDQAIFQTPDYSLNGMALGWNLPVHWGDFPTNQPVLLDFEWSKRAVLLVDGENLNFLKGILSALNLIMDDEDFLREIEQERFREQMLEFIIAPSGKLNFSWKPRPFSEPIPVLQGSKLLVRSLLADLPRKKGEHWLIEVFSFPRPVHHDTRPYYPVLVLSIAEPTGLSFPPSRLHPDKLAASFEEEMSHRWHHIGYLPERMSASNPDTYRLLAPMLKEINIPLDRVYRPAPIEEAKDRLFFAFSI